MTEGLRNAMRGEAQRVQTDLAAGVRMGTVDSVDPEKHAVRVRVQPDGVLTGWVPVMALSAGAGWGLHALPRAGTQVVMGFQEGGFEAGVVLGSLYDDQHRPPGTPGDAVWLTHDNGARIQLNADGTIDRHAGEIRDDADTLHRITSAVLAKVEAQTSQVIASALASITSPDIQLGAAGQTLRKVMTEAAATVLNGHTHPVPGGGGTSGPPNQQLSAAHLTSSVKAA